MARYNEILVGRFNRHFQKLLSMKGEPPAPQLSTEIQPALQLFGGAEERYTQGWDLFSASTSLQNPAQVTAYRLRNPPNSGVLAVISKAAYNNAPTGEVQFLHGTSSVDQVTIISSSQKWDFRGRTNPACIFSANDNATGSLGGSLVSKYSILASSPWDFLDGCQPHEFPLLPGDFVGIASGTANALLYVTFFWRERPLEDSEKT